MSSKPESNIPWWAIVAGFIIYAPIGFILLFMKIAGVQLPFGKTKAQRQFEQNFRRSAQRQTPPAGATASGAYRYSYTQQTGQQKTQPGQQQTTQQTGQQQTTQQAGQQKQQQAAGEQGGYPPRRFFKVPKGGKAMTIIGSIMTFVFGIGFVDTFIDALRWGLLLYADEWLPLLGFLCAGVFLLGRGISKTRQSRRAKLYQNVIGQRSSVFIADLASTAGVTQQQVMTDLQNMLADGTLPNGYIDKASKRLILTDLGYVPPEAEAEQAPKKKSSKKKEEAPKEDPDAALLRQIREVNDAIADPEMSRKIDRIEEITGKILAYQKNNPNKAGELRQFLSYYLPTTLKILSAYGQMEAQGIEGENISASKRRIEGMMDKVVEGFEKQLDQLFSSDALDIATDVEVLERMLDKDGLGSGMTLGG